jgi:hypothetical protein
MERTMKDDYPTNGNDERMDKRMIIDDERMKLGRV